MPWCEDCAKFWNPNTVPPDGTCPTCGRVIAEPPPTRVPWHFWVLIAGTVVYLGYRAYEGFVWLVDNGNTAIAIVLGLVLAGLTAAGVWWWFSTDEEAEPPASSSGPDPRAQPEA